LQRLVIAVLSVCGLLLVTLAAVVVTVVRRWRRLKAGRDVGDDGASTPGVHLDDLVKLLCYTGRRRRRPGAKPPVVPGHSEPAAVNRPALPDHSELVQLVLRSQSVAGGVMHENDRYSTASDINARGASTLSSRSLHFA